MAKLPITTPAVGDVFTVGTQRTAVEVAGRIVGKNSGVVESTGTDTGLTDAQSAELIALGNIPDADYTPPAMLATGVAAVIRYTEGSVRAYRLIMTTGRSTYTLTAP